MQSNSIKICEICEKDFVPVPENTSTVCDECIAREPKRETEVEDELQDHAEMCHKSFDLKSEIKEEHEVTDSNERPCFNATCDKAQNDSCNYSKQDYSENHLSCTVKNEDTFILENNLKICDKSFELKSELIIKQEEHEVTASSARSCSFEICDTNVKAQNDSCNYIKQDYSENYLLCTVNNEDTFILENDLKKCNKSFELKSELIIKEEEHEVPASSVRPCSFEICDNLQTQTASHIYIKQECSENPLLCTICNKGFSSANELKQHESICVTERYECDICKETFKNKISLRLHRLVEHEEKRFKCNICNKRFEFKKNLSEHKAAAHLDAIHVCDKCYKCYEDLTSLRLHVREEHGNLMPAVCNKRFLFAKDLKQRELICVNEQYQCDIWKTTSKEKACVKQHTRETHEEERLTCNICNKRFSSQSRLKQHESLCGKEKYECDICKETFMLQRSLINHRVKHEKLFTCNVCNKSFCFAKNLQQHETLCGKEKYECDTCKKTFKSERSLINHRVKHEKRFTCNLCKRSFSFETTLQQHQSFCVKKRNVRYECGTCKKTFKCKYNLRKHREKQHEGKRFMCKICYRRFFFEHELEQHASFCVKKTYECDSCKETFNWKRSLRNHIIKHEEKRFTCKLCNKSFYLAKHLQQHESLCVNKKYECDICKNRFKLKSSLGLHRFKHEEKRFTCNTCHKSFTYKSVLKEHELCTHSSEKLHACDKCDVRVKHKSSLRAHMRVKHGEKNKIYRYTSVAPHSRVNESHVIILRE